MPHKIALDCRKPHWISLALGRRQLSVEGLWLMMHGNDTCWSSCSKKRVPAGVHGVTFPCYNTGVFLRQREIICVKKIMESVLYLWTVHFNRKAPFLLLETNTCWRLGDFSFLPAFKPQSLLASYFQHSVCLSKY